MNADRINGRKGVSQMRYQFERTHQQTSVNYSSSSNMQHSRPGHKTGLDLMPYGQYASVSTLNLNASSSSNAIAIDHNQRNQPKRTSTHNKVALCNRSGRPNAGHLASHTPLTTSNGQAILRAANTQQHYNSAFLTPIAQGPTPVNLVHIYEDPGLLWFKRVGRANQRSQQHVPRNLNAVRRSDHFLQFTVDKVKVPDDRRFSLSVREPARHVIHQQEALDDQGSVQVIHSFPLPINKSNVLSRYQSLDSISMSGQPVFDNGMVDVNQWKWYETPDNLSDLPISPLQQAKCRSPLALSEDLSRSYIPFSGGGSVRVGRTTARPSLNNVRNGSGYMQRYNSSTELKGLQQSKQPLKSVRSIKDLLEYQAPTAQDENVPMDDEDDEQIPTTNENEQVNVRTQQAYQSFNAKHFSFLNKTSSPKKFTSPIMDSSQVSSDSNESPPNFRSKMRLALANNNMLTGGPKDVNENDKIPPQSINSTGINPVTCQPFLQCVLRSSTRALCTTVTANAQMSPVSPAYGYATLNAEDRRKVITRPAAGAAKTKALEPVLEESISEEVALETTGSIGDLTVPKPTDNRRAKSVDRPKGTRRARLSSETMGNESSDTNTTTKQSSVDTCMECGFTVQYDCISIKQEGVPRLHYHRSCFKCSM